MLTKRIIPCLDVKDGRVVKGVKFLDLRDAGDPVEAAAAYDRQGADELCFLDITASHERRRVFRRNDDISVCSKIFAHRLHVVTAACIAMAHHHYPKGAGCLCKRRVNVTLTLKYEQFFDGCIDLLCCHAIANGVRRQVEKCRFCHHQPMHVAITEHVVTVACPAICF